jgi:hypothetical protein
MNRSVVIDAFDERDYLIVNRLSTFRIAFRSVVHAIYVRMNAILRSKDHATPSRVTVSALEYKEVRITIVIASSRFHGVLIHLVGGTMVRAIPLERKPCT